MRTVRQWSHGGSGGAHTASTEISPSLTCENHVQHGKQVLTSTTLIRTNTCPRRRSAQTCLCGSPRDAHSAIAPPNFFQKHEGAAPDLVSLPRRSGCRSRLRLIDHERVSPRQIQLKAQPSWLCGELARMRSVTMGAKDDHKGLRAAIRPFPSAIQRSDTVCGAARTVSLPMGRDNLSRGGKYRLLQPLLPRTQKRQELSANIRSTCVKQSTHAATVQNVDPTQACAVYKAKRLVYHDRLKRRLFPHSDPPQTSEISEVCVRRNSVPIQRTPIRPVPSAE